MVFFAYHGYYAAERKGGHRFELDVTLELDFDDIVKSGDLDDSINYESVYTLCAEHMSRPRRLLETVLAELLEAVLQGHQRCLKVTISLRKYAPQLGGALGYVELTDTRQREGHA